MPDVLPTINNEPAQGIQATLDTLYLWNPDVANELIEQINALLEELEGVSGTVKPYSELEAPVKQYVPMFYGDGLYVAAEDMEELPAEPDLSDWILVATKATDLTAGDGIVISDGVISVTQAISQGAAAGATAVQPESLGTAAYASTTDFATASQGTKADTAVQPSDLGTAAYASTTDFATSTQGAKADTAIQPADLGTAAYAATTDFATATQGAKADTALQPGSSVPQYSTMPVAASTNVGEIVQYIGAPASGYTTGYFYKCVEDDGVYSWENVNVQDEPSIGRFLSLWNCATGLAETNPPQSPYTYRAGDYFIVGTVSSATPAVNYKPNGATYVIGTASSTVESDEVYPGDSYFYDGTAWRLQSNTAKTVTFASIAGDVYDNQSAAGALNAKQDALVSGTNIKTINGTSVLGSGNIEISTFLPYPAGWTTNSTTKAFCDSVAADTTATVGKAYLGEVTFSDLPASIRNAEVNVYINDGTTAANKVIVLELASGNVAPYRWIYVYWDGGSNVSGWKTWQEPLVSGTNIKTINGSSILGSGDITTEAIQLSALPTASAAEEGNIYQFVGTTGTYTNGYFYKCIHVSASATATSSNPDVTVSVDAQTFAEQVSESGQYVFEYDAGTDAWYDSDNNQVNLADFGISKSGVSISQDTITVDYVAESYDWQRTDVQPAPIIPDPLPNQTGNAGKFLITDGTDASWGTTITDTLKIYLASGNYYPFDLRGPGGVSRFFMTLGSSSNSASTYINVSHNGTGGSFFLNYDKSTSGHKALRFYASTSQYVDEVELGRSSDKWTRLYVENINNGADIAVPTVAGSVSVQVSSMPTASSTLEGQIYQFTGTTNSTYTNGRFYKCVSDGQATPTYSWTEVSMGGGGSGSVPTLTWYSVSTAGNTLTIADTSSAALVKIYKNGLLLEPTADYSISGTTLTMVTALVVGDKITTEVF